MYLQQIHQVCIGGACVRCMRSNCLLASVFYLCLGGFYLSIYISISICLSIYLSVHSKEVFFASQLDVLTQGQNLNTPKFMSQLLLLLLLQFSLLLLLLLRKHSVQMKRVKTIKTGGSQSKLLLLRMQQQQLLLEQHILLLQERSRGWCCFYTCEFVGYCIACCDACSSSS